MEYCHFVVIQTCPGFGYDEISWHPTKEDAKKVIKEYQKDCSKQTTYHIEERYEICEWCERAIKLGDKGYPYHEVCAIENSDYGPDGR